jgi:nitrate/nitrite-specific signal transduction histidine kinase
VETEVTYNQAASERTAEEAKGAIAQVYRLIAVTIPTVLLASLAVIWLFSHRVTRPLSRLTAAMLEMARAAGYYRAGR